jgi:hypothetical protein
MANEIDQQIQDFHSLYIILCSDYNRFKKAYPKSTLNPGQLKILLAFHSYLKRKKNCIDLFKSIKNHHPFFEGVKYCLLGLAHNHFGNYKFALEHLLKGRELLKGTSSDYFKILNSTTLFLTYANRSEVAPLHGLIDEIYECKAPNDFCRLSQVMCKAIYLQLMGETNKSNKVINAEFKKQSERFSTFELSFIIIRFMNYFKENDFKRCEEELKTYKNATGFTSGANYKFMHLLFDHVVTGAPLYVYKSDFAASSELYEQLMVIKSLAEGEPAKALGYWKKLAKHNDQVYGEEFSYHGGVSLFGAALEKQLDQNLQSKIDFESLRSLKSINEKLQYIFENGPDTLKKDQLIMWLWNVESSEKTRARLRKAICDFHNKFGEKFRTYQDTYQKLKKSA